MELITIFCSSALQNYNVGVAAHAIICKKLRTSPVQLCVHQGWIVAHAAVECNTVQEWAALELQDQQQQQG